MNKTYTIGLTILIIATVAVGSFLYLTRPVAPPSTDITKSVEKLERAEATSTTTAFYRISQPESKAQFSINEVLRGSPFTAVGITNQIAGDIEINTANPSLSRIGVIRINARTLKTESPQRDGAIARFILKSEDPANEFIEFRLTSLSGLPATIKQGVEFNFRIPGDLTISGITKPAVFQATAKLESGDQLSGTAEATVKRSDYNLKIPNIPFVASVADNVMLKVLVVAKRVTGE